MLDGRDYFINTTARMVKTSTAMEIENRTSVPLSVKISGEEISITIPNSRIFSKVKDGTIKRIIVEGK